MKRTWLALGLVMCLLLCFATGVRADFGDFSGGGDYGGGSDWGGSSSDWGGSSGSNNYYYYGGSSGSGSGGGSSFTLAVFVVAIILVVLALKDSRKGKKKSNSSRGPLPAGASYTTGLTPIQNYCKVDLNFDEQEFKEKLSNLYVQMQNGWMEQDIESLRPYFTDALFTQMERQLNSMKKQGIINRVERIAVLDVQLRGYKVFSGEDHIYAMLKTRILDYTVNREGKLVSGSNTKNKFMTYEWELSRKSGVSSKTQEEKEGRVICPSCGAPLDINASARCPYCGSVIQMQQEDWAIAAIKGISQFTER